MKKYLKILFIMVIALAIPLSVFAKTKVEGTDIVDIETPDNWKMFTRNNLDEMFTWLNFNDSQKSSYKYAWTNNSYYFDIINESKDKEIILIKKISDFELEDLSINLDEKILELAENIKKEYGTYEPKVSLHTTSSGIKYYKVEYKDNSSNYSIVDYITTIHGYMYEYKFQSSVEISNEVTSNVEKMLDSIEYENYLEFIKNNKITIEEKKSSNSSAIIIIILIIIIGGGVGTYIIINKKKNNKNSNIQTQVYSPVQPNSSNPAVSDFLNPSTPNITTQSNNQEQPKQENNNINNGQ